jgi:hypothetical protein
MLNKFNPYHNKGIMINDIPFSRKEVSTFLALSAAIALLLLSSPLPLSNFLLQPAQAQTTMTFKTLKPATYTDPDTGQEFTLTFDAQGTATASGPQAAKITNGTIHTPDFNGDGSQTLTGSITSGAYITSRQPPGIQFYATIQNVVYLVESACTTSDDNPISISATGSSNGFVFSGAVECSPSEGGGDTTAQPSSSSLTGSSQGTDRGSSSSSNSTDSDRDGIPDSSDRRCTHNSHQRCFKEDTTTHQQQQQQQQPSSSNGNQTKG